MKFNYLTLIILAFATSCSHNIESHDSSKENDTHEGSHGGHGDLIELSEHEAHRFGIQCDIATEGNIAETTMLPGIIVSSSSSQTTLSAAKSGTLTWSVKLHEGMPVHAGQIIATVNAIGISGGDADAAARERLAALDAEIKRIKPLVDDGIIPRKDYIALVAEAEQQRKLTHTSTGANRIVSPISGIISQVTAGDGSFVNTGDQVAVVRASGNTSGSMLRVDLPQRFLPRLSEIRSASVVTPQGTRIDLPRSTTSPVADSNGFMPIYFGPASESTIMPGTTLEASVAFGGKGACITLPTKAINEQEGVYSVFVKEKPGHYRRVPVEIGMTDNISVEILSGIDKTDSVVTSGSVLLRLAETRANAPQGHTHNH